MGMYGRTRIVNDEVMDHLLKSLTEPQRAAVTHRDGPLLVLAGPGSGKTRVITHRIAYLIENGVNPSDILALTFTNKAASEMQRRVAELAPGSRVWLSTFHRFGAMLLRRYAEQVGLQPNFTIYDTGDARRYRLHPRRCPAHLQDRQPDPRQGPGCPGAR